MPKGKKEKKGRKIGRTGRSPSTKRRKLYRPDLRRKFKNVLKAGGIEAAEKWALLAINQRSEPAGMLLKMIEDSKKKAS
ncbi:MAG: hypothetical protein ACXABY_24885 [Candidatus Thorarchaeota archaeon]|jgi:hypothetical protein